MTETERLITLYWSDNDIFFFCCFVPFKFFLCCCCWWLEWVFIGPSNYNIVDKYFCQHINWPIFSGRSSRNAFHLLIEARLLLLHMWNTHTAAATTKTTMISIQWKLYNLMQSWNWLVLGVYDNGKKRRKEKAGRNKRDGKGKKNNKIHFPTNWTKSNAWRSHHNASLSRRKKEREKRCEIKT